MVRDIDIKNYHQFCTMCGLKQNKISDRIISSHFNSNWSYSSNFSSESFRERCYWRTNIWLSTYFCTRKVSRLKTGGFHKYLNFRLFKNYTVEYYNKSLIKQLDLRNYETFNVVNGVYSNFFQKIMTVIDKIAPCRNIWVKRNTQKWFGSEVLKKLNARDKLFLMNSKSQTS